LAKGENKEKIVDPLLRAVAEQGRDGKVVLIGIAQKKASGWQKAGIPYEALDNGSAAAPTRPPFSASATDWVPMRCAPSSAV